MNLSPAEQDLLAKAKAADVIPHGPYRQWWEYNRAATPAAIIDLLTRLVAAREVIAKLPRTADGVPIVPGMTVWSETPKAHTVTWIHHRLVKARCECHNDELTMDTKEIHKVYSTREAALVAQSPAAGEGEHGKI